MTRSSPASMRTFSGPPEWPMSRGLGSDRSGFSPPQRNPFPAAHPSRWSGTTGDADETRRLDPAVDSLPGVATLFPKRPLPAIRPGEPSKTHPGFLQCLVLIFNMKICGQTPRKRPAKYLGFPAPIPDGRVPKQACLKAGREVISLLSDPYEVRH